MKEKIILMLALMSFSFLKGDDIDIYTGSKGDFDNKNNIMIILDTSGSMNERLSTGETRFEQAKNGLTSVIRELPDRVNVGLARFNFPGGSIAYPIRNLADYVPQEISKTVVFGENDAYEIKSGQVFNSTTTLEFAGATTTVSSRVNRSTDDAEQCPNGTNFLTNAQYLDINFDIAACYIDYNGVIFRNLNIPKDAVIVDAYIRMRLYNNSLGDADTRITVEDRFNPPTYSIGQDLISRSELRDENNNILGVNWRVPSATWGNYLTTPNLKDLVQPFVNGNDWDRNNNGLSFFFKMPEGGNRGTRVSFYTFDNSSTWAPELFVTYKLKNDNNKVGIRFEDVNVPSNVVLSKATLNLTASRDNNSGFLNIKLESNKNNQPFSETAYNISNRNTEIYSKNINYTNWNQNEVYSFDVMDILSEKFNNGIWCGGESLSFILESEEVQQIYASEHSTQNTPTLNIDFVEAQGDACSMQNEVKQITNNSDDARERYNNGRVDIGNGSIVVSNSILAGFLFRDVNVTKTNNIQIIEAYLEFTSSGNDSGNTIMRIKGQKTGNASTFNTTRYNLTNRTKTNSFVDWSITGDTVVGRRYRTPDISDIITEIVNEPNWEAGNNMLFFIEAVNGNRRFGAADPNPSQSPKLIIRYKGEGSYQGLTVREQLINEINNSTTDGYTPIEGSIYEVAQYFLGRNVDYGKTRNPSYSGFAGRRISNESSFSNGTRHLPTGCTLDNLNSPNCRYEQILGNPVYNRVVLGETCETNSIILVTDGYPFPYYSGWWYDYYYRNNDNIPLSQSIRNLTGKSCNDNYSCGEVLTEYLFETDFAPNSAGKQNIYTYVIGFDELDSTGYLNRLARKGGGYFLSATGTQGLVNALSQVISTILDIDTTLAAPGVSVNQNNRFEHLKEVYYSVFKPSDRRSWYGNLKKYQIDDINKTLTDKHGNPAVDPDTGFFKKGTTSFWSTIEDGHDVQLGGAASKIKSPYRVFTYTSENEPNNVNLNHSNHIFHENNSLLTKSLFNLDSSFSNQEFNNLLKWGRGLDVLDENFNGITNEYRKTWGSPLHSRPILINYNDDENYIFVSTNRGYLHAVDSENGETLFSFIPQEMLPNLYDHYLNEPGKLIYGLDSSWVAWRHDANKDNKISAVDGDHVYIYAGMRRGGKTYYALDVTDINNPKLKFKIDPNKSPEFSNMGQTWSEPILAQIKINNQEKVVLIFGGGYDPAHDNPSYDGLSDNFGNQIYIVDAKTGNLIWWASGIGSGANLEISGMNHSIVSRIEALDLNNNNFVDYLYFGDLAGQVFKININNLNSGVSNFATGKMIAKLGRTANVDSTQFRKIYEPIRAVPVRKPDEQFVALVFGTGYRAKPLDKHLRDIVVVIKDKENYFNSSSNIISSPYLLSNLENVTNNVNKNTINNLLLNKNGYYINLVEQNGNYIGEKMLSEPIVYNNTIILSTYVPDRNVSLCSPVQGSSRVYQMNIFNLLPLEENIKDPNNPDLTDRYLDNFVPGITSGTKIIYTENSVLSLTNTKIEELNKSGGLGVKKVFWYSEESK